MSFVTWMKGFLFVGRQDDVLQSLDEGHLVYEKAGKRPS